MQLLKIFTMKVPYIGDSSPLYFKFFCSLLSIPVLAKYFLYSLQGPFPFCGKDLLPVLKGL